MIRCRLQTILLLLGVIALFGLGWLARSIFSDSGFLTEKAVANSKPSDPSPIVDLNRPLPVRVFRLGSLEAPERVDRYRGVIEPSKTANLSFRRGGRLAEIRVREGDPVKQGDLLAALETQDVQATIRGIESRIKEAQAVLAEQTAGPRPETIKAAQAVLSERESALSLARITLKRESSLLKSRASSQQAYDEAKASLDRTTASVEAAREQLNELLAGTRIEQINAQKARIDSLTAQRDDLIVQLDDCQLIAPFSGVVAQRFVDEGVIAGPELPILKLLQVDPLEARFGVSASDAARLRVGQQVNLTADRKKACGKISRIEPELDLATRTQGVVVSVDQSTHSQGSSPLIPGETVSLAFSNFAVEISSSDGTGGIENPTAENSFWVPLNSLSRSVRGLWSVMKLTQSADQSWIVERHLVQVVEVEGDLSRIHGGTLNEGERIVSDGIHRLAPGIRVEPVETGSVETGSSKGNLGPQSDQYDQSGIAPILEITDPSRE